MYYKYTIGDLNLLSEIKIPILRLNNFNKPDIEIIFKSNIKPPNSNIQLLDDGKILYKDNYENTFLIIGSKIFIDAKKENLNHASISILGIPMGYLLQENGFQVLHGSSVGIKNSAICFIGKSGDGKSSIALQLINKGYKLITEDLCLIKNANLYNFSNWIKSSNESFPKNLNSEEKIIVKKDSRKRAIYRLSDKYVTKRLASLETIYFLADGKKRNIAKIKPSESFKYLFTYAYRKKNLDIKSLKKLTKISENTECFLFSRDVNKPLQDNVRYVYDHLNEKYSGVLHSR